MVESNQSDYQRVARAKKTFMFWLPCLEKGKGSEMQETVQAVCDACHAWWPPGMFSKENWVPTLTDVDKLAKDLLQLIPLSANPTAAAASHAAVAAPFYATAATSSSDETGLNRQVKRGGDGSAASAPGKVKRSEEGRKSPPPSARSRRRCLHG